MEVAGPLGTPLGLAQRKRASPRGEAGTSGFLCARARYSVSREVPRPVLKCETLLGTLDATPNVPRQCMKVKSESEVAQSCPTLSDPMDCSLLGSSIYGIF